MELRLQYKVALKTSCIGFIALCSRGCCFRFALWWFSVVKVWCKSASASARACVRKKLRNSFFLRQNKCQLGFILLTAPVVFRLWRMGRFQLRTRFQELIRNPTCFYSMLAELTFSRPKLSEKFAAFTSMFEFLLLAGFEPLGMLLSVKRVAKLFITASRLPLSQNSFL